MKESGIVRGVVVITIVSVMLAMGCATRTTSQTQAPAGPIRATTIEPGVIPSGTTFAIRTNEAINSEQTSRTFSAQVEQDVIDQNGQLLIPKGSPAELVINRTSEGGMAGTATMDLAIRSVTVRGRNYPITTAGVQQEGNAGIGANRRTAGMVGGGAALGTLIGAAAGGAKGAAIGAITGAAGGAAVQVLTRGKEVNVPAETVLTFRLDQPWRLEGYY